jgi:hypothetical protein
MFKRIALLLGTVMIATVVAHPWAAQAGGSFNKGSCTFNGKRLYGKVQEVSSGADLTVQVVSTLADLKVQKVSALPSSCGQWQMVDALGDFKVKFVSSLADLKIQYVSSLPGAN